MKTATTPVLCEAIPCSRWRSICRPRDRELCSQSTISRLENLPDARALLRMGRAMVDLYCESFHKGPKRIVLDTDDTFDAVHGGQQLRLTYHQQQETIKRLNAGKDTQGEIAR